MAGLLNLFRLSPSRRIERIVIELMMVKRLPGGQNYLVKDYQSLPRLIDLRRIEYSLCYII
jgi:hypothetical protein